MSRLNFLPIQLHKITLPLLVITIAIIAFLFESNLFQYQRNLFESGEFWRGFTSHFLHTNINHLILNISAVALLWALHGQYYSFKSYLTVFVFSAVMTTLGVYLYSPEITQYVGLSGVLHGIFIWGALKDVEHKEKTGYLLLIGIAGKVMYEQIAGPSQDVAELISATVAIDAHLWGTIGGVLIGLISMLYRYKSKTF